MTRRDFAVGLGIGALLAFPLGCGPKEDAVIEPEEVNVDGGMKEEETDTSARPEGADADAAAKGEG